jgi:hypothetical protein
MSFSNNKCQHSTEDIAHTLQNIKHIVLTWPSAANTDEDRCLQKSMVESLKSILAHLQFNDNVSLLDVEDDEDSCGSNHGAPSEDDGDKLDLDNDEVVYFSFCI